MSPGSAVTGFPPGIVLGTIHAGDAVAAQAQSDLTIAYNDAAGRACDTNLTGQDLGGLTLTPGVYCFSSSAQLTGALTLDAQGDPDAVFIFQIGSTLITASASTVNLINGAQACNVFWQVGSSATLGTNSIFRGTILALTSITVTTGATVEGRTLARNGAVTLDNNVITTPMCASPPPTTTTTPPTTTTTPPTTTTSGGAPGAPPAGPTPTAPGSHAETGADMTTLYGLLAMVFGVGSMVAFRLRRTDG
ncbi:MAG: ice-binding family protein [Acidimicrobiia bacterium]